MSKTSAATFFRLLASAAVAVVTGAGAHAGDGESCAEALRRLDSAAKPPASETECVEALRAAEEENWQLLLDLAFAEEETGHPKKAWETYVRFLDATAGPGAALPAAWGELRTRAEASVARLEQALLKSHARVVVTPRPETRTVHFFGEVLRANPGSGPITRFLPVGSHTVIVADPATGRYREVAFTVSAGETRDVVVELDPVGGPSAAARTDVPVVAANGAGRADVASVGAVAARPKQQPLWRSVGAAAIGVGVAATAVGAGFLASSHGLYDDAACSGALCDIDAAARARIRADASVAEDRAVASFVTGGLLLAGGATALILEALGIVGAPEATAAGTPRLKRLTPTFARGGAGVAAAIGF